MMQPQAGRSSVPVNITSNIGVIGLRTALPQRSKFTSKQRISIRLRTIEYGKRRVSLRCTAGDERSEFPDSHTSSRENLHKRRGQQVEQLDGYQQPTPWSQRSLFDKTKAIIGLSAVGLFAFMLAPRAAFSATEVPTQDAATATVVEEPKKKKKKKKKKEEDKEYVFSFEGVKEDGTETYEYWHTARNGQTFHRQVEITPAHLADIKPILLEFKNLSLDDRKAITIEYVNKYTEYGDKKKALAKATRAAKRRDAERQNQKGEVEGLDKYAYRKGTTLSYSQLWEMVGKREVKSALYNSDRESVTVVLREDAVAKLEKGQKVKTYRVMLPFDPDLLEFMIDKGVDVDCSIPGKWETFFTGWAPVLMPFISLFVLTNILEKTISASKPDDLNSSLAKKIRSHEVGVSLNDVAGIECIEEEITELVTYLKDAGRYLRMGARLPAGVLLVGPPGTGKTLLAKAVAGEAGVPFFAVAGSDFSEMFVGVGAARVRSLFKDAREAAPCIIFIDEFDAVGTARDMASGSGSAQGSEESANTINQMLTEMDGFEENRGIVVLAATNRPGVLDEALTRPGRFDRVVHLPLPTIEGRMEILEVHSRNKVVAPDVDWRRVARCCQGWTGADLANLMNEAAICSIRELQAKATDEEDTTDQDFAIEERHIMSCIGNIKTAAVASDGITIHGHVGGEMDDIDGDLLQAVSLHEAGRAVIATLLPLYDEVQSVAVFPGGMAVSMTSFVPKEAHLESNIMSRAYLESELVLCFAGRVAEVLLLGAEKLSTASIKHLDHAHTLARKMVLRYGMNNLLGPVSYMGVEGKASFLKSRRDEEEVADLDPRTAELVLQECAYLLDQAEERALQGVLKNMAVVKAVAKAIVDSETRTLTGLDVQAICRDMAAQPFELDEVEFQWDRESAELLEPGSRELEAIGATAYGLPVPGSEDGDAKKVEDKGDSPPPVEPTK